MYGKEEGAWLCDMLRVPSLAGLVWVNLDGNGKEGMVGFVGSEQRVCHYFVLRNELMEERWYARKNDCWWKMDDGWEI